MTIEMKRLEGKTALVTGCNRGIGKAIVERIARDGADIFAITRNIDENVNDWYKQICERYNVKVYPYTSDLGNVDAIKALMKLILSTKIPIDIVVNNAGIASFKPFVMTSLDDFNRIMQVNVYAPMLISQFAVRSMMKRRNGCIINLSSVSGMDATTGNAAYGASKAALASLTRTMSKELSKLNIRVNAIAPGFVMTDMQDNIDNNYLESIKGEISLGRFATPEEIANLVAFLASDEASYITGQVIRIDGGM